METTKAHVLNCQFSSWYPKFKKLTPRARILKPIPPSVLNYLNQDGIFLGGSDDDENEDDGEIKDEDDENVQRARVSAEDLKLITDTIEELGGSVVPKLNWSTPKDALWIAPTNSLKCTNASDILLLLKASDFVAHDLDDPFDNCKDDVVGKLTENFSYELVLKEWFPIHTSHEYRCFVKGRKLVAVSQRDPNYYDFLEKEAPEHLELLIELSEKLHDFPDENFVFDAYIQKDRAFLIDINPYSLTTDGQLFSWSEINKLNTDDPVLRLVPKGPFGSSGSMYSENRVPFDMVAANLGGNISEFANSMQQSMAAEEKKDKF
ncbi:D123 family protein [Schizosaccharomyces japonicus yFS275]|uniref:D123 family protein n=1 Tax=Schizosaccharomyces japonicus (strain yFS275 / FY16936) TaxID=402676 RepID=B6JVE5_SCHJY|nr:D123 family protein [Schizosaccharomyces japonicus yFS275]EEB05346.2 D123 family protein [Schizosaccharomyces japonicus yFS275]